MPPMKRTLVAVVCCALISHNLKGQAPRDVEVARWQEIRQFDDRSGTHLVNPGQIVWCGNQIIVIDYSEMTLVAFGIDFEPRWRFGRRGAGPGEFNSPNDMTCDRQGNVWVADEGNSRLTVVSRTGQLERLIRLESPAYRVAASTADSPVIVVTRQQLDLVSLIEHDGTLIRRVPAPAALAAIDMLRREPITAGAADGTLFMGFRWDSRVLRISAAGEVTTFATAVEEIRFPETRAYQTESRSAVMVRIDPRAPEATQRMVVTDSAVYVLFAGRSRDVGKVIDRYHRPDGAYMNSWLLPNAPRDFAVRGDTLLVLGGEVHPTLWLLRPRRD